MRISHLFILLAASAMLTACDFLDEYNPNSVTVGNYYTSEEDIVASLNGVYTSLTQSYVADNYHYFTDVRANATVVTNSGANSGIPYQFYNYTLTEENVYVYNRYSQLYKNKFFSVFSTIPSIAIRCVMDIFCTLHFVVNISKEFLL